MKLSKVVMTMLLILAIVLGTGCTNNKKPKTIEKPIPTNIPRYNTPYYKTIRENVPKTYELYPDNYTEMNPLALNSVNTACMQFYAVTDFNTLTATCPSYGNNIGTIKMSIYKWDINLDITLTSKVLREASFENFIDNDSLEFDFEPLPEGEYILELSGIYEDTGVWMTNKKRFGTRVYYNGVQQEGSFLSSIGYLHTTDVFVGPLSDNIEYELEYLKTPNEFGFNKDVLNRGVRPDTWAAYDALSRSVPSSSDVSIKEDKDRKVGIIYYLRPNVKNPKRNLTELLSRYPDATKNPNHGIWNSYTTLYWNEPLFGFYNGIDKLVYRKHAELLSDAGVDVIFINLADGLNKDLYEALLETWSNARKDGVDTPQISFITDYNNPQNGIYQLKNLFQEIYKPQRYHELWFYVDGKPLAFCQNELLNKNIRNDEQLNRYFTFRKISTDYYKNTTSEGVWGIQSVFPQTRNSFNKQGDTEQISVSPAQNVNDRGITVMNGEGVYGRSYSKRNYSYTYDYMGNVNTVDSYILNSKLYGINFQQQWDYAHYVDPDIVIVNGWNEGIAKLQRGESYNAFPNQYNDEYSTDIEPSKGELKDNYYYQLVANIRRFKGVNELDYSSTLSTIDITKGVNDWDSVKLSYNHYLSNIENGNIRNDIVSAKVAYDRNSIYFYVETRNDITDITDASWMRLFIDTEESNESWEGYEYIVNRLNPTSTVCYLEKSISGWDWQLVGELKYSVDGKVLQIEIPRHMLGIKSGWFSGMPSFNFKWADNVRNDGDISEFYLSGDVAPGGRFSFRYNTN